MTIINDQQLKQALSELTIANQRVIASQYISNVIHLNSDEIIKKALKMLQQEGYSESELRLLYDNIVSLSVNTYTACGNDVDWMAQAAHFVATATKACLTPEDLLENNANLAWKTAMQTRMAINCEMVESDNQSDEGEAQKQYQITNHYISD